MPHTHEDLDDIVLPYFNKLYNSKKILQLRYFDDIDNIVLRAEKNGNLQDVKLCIIYGIGPITFIQALFNSVFNKHLNIFCFLFNNFPQELLLQKPDIVKKMLYKAVSLGHENIVTLLFKNFPQELLPQKSDIVTEALNIAVSNNRTSIVSIIFNNFPQEMLLNKPTILKDLILKKVQSAEMANTIQQLGTFELNTDELTECLLDKIKESWDDTPSDLAINRFFQTRFDTSMITWLCRQGADVNAVKPAPYNYNSGGSSFTLLMWAIQQQNKSVIEILYEFGADIDKQVTVSPWYNTHEKRTISAGDMLRSGPDNTIFLDRLIEKTHKKAERTIHSFFKQITTDTSATPNLVRPISSVNKDIENLIVSYYG